MRLAYSQRLFALSRAGYLPKWLSQMGKRCSPYWALIVPGSIGFILTCTSGKGALLNTPVFGSPVSYVLLNLSHIVLERKEPGLPRGYRTRGGVVTTSIAPVFAAVVVIATVVVDVFAASITAALFGAVFLCYWFYSRPRIAAGAPEEEFAQLVAAEAEPKS